MSGSDHDLQTVVRGWKRIGDNKIVCTYYSRHIPAMRRAGLGAQQVADIPIAFDRDLDWVMYSVILRTGLPIAFQSGIPCLQTIFKPGNRFSAY